MKKFNILFLIILVVPALVSAEVDKVYHPYVEAYKSEIEYRILYKNDDGAAQDGTQFHRLSFGHALTERFSLEAYVIGKNLPKESFSIDGYELEGKLQLTEQGEFWSDWGLLFELEHDTEQKKIETGIALLLEKEWGKWVGTVNLFAEYEFGRGVEDEIEGASRGQVRYRWARYFEPAIELYMDEQTRGIGPVFLGSQKIGVNNLNWELGFIFGFNKKTANQNLRFLLDYEF